MLKPNLTQLCSALLLSVCIGYAQAWQSTDVDANSDNDASSLSVEQSTIATDFGFPVKLTSNHQALDGKNKTSIFSENVVIRQGSLELLADRVEVDATAGQRKEIIMATGQPASYKQKLEDGTTVSAQANEIIYMVESRTISLKGNASIQQNEVLVDGDEILFDMAKEQILASTNENSTAPVTTVISPGAFGDELPKQP